MSDAAIVGLELDTYAKILPPDAVAVLFLIRLQIRKGVRVRLSAEMAFGMMPLQPAAEAGAAVGLSSRVGRMKTA
jgi:hypothetical protein